MPRLSPQQLSTVQAAARTIFNHIDPSAPKQVYRKQATKLLSRTLIGDNLLHSAGRDIKIPRQLTVCVISIHRITYHIICTYSNTYCIIICFTVYRIHININKRRKLVMN